MASVNLQGLLENGLYFGHPSKQFDPRMKPYIYGKRQGIYIIDLEKTRTCLEKACEFLRETVSEGREIILVGTKRQVRDLIKDSATKHGLLFMANRWLGGTLTNFQTLKHRIDRMNELEAKEASGAFEKLSKKDAAVARQEKERLLKNLEGVKNLKRTPHVMLVVDARKEEIAIREAKKMGMKLVGVVDTNSNPNLLDYPIPANDDGIKGLRFLFSQFNEAFSAGLAERRKNQPPEPEVKKEAAPEKPVKKEPEAKSAEPVVSKAAPAEEAATAEPPEKEEKIAAEAEKEDRSKKKKLPVKPKPRPRIRAKVRRVIKKSSAAESKSKPGGAKAKA